MAWLIEIKVSNHTPQYIWCDWPRSQRCLYKYAPLIGSKYMDQVGSFASYNGESWFEQWDVGSDPDILRYKEAPGSEGRGSYVTTRQVNYVLKLVGLKHDHPKVPAFGQTRKGTILANTIPWAEREIIWTTMANYPGS